MIQIGFPAMSFNSGLFSGVTSDLIAGIILASIGALLAATFGFARKSLKRWRHKTLIYVVTKLRIQSEGHMPYGTRRIGSLGGGESSPVFDESISFNLLTTNYRAVLPQSMMTTIGEVDGYQVLPQFILGRDANPLVRKSRSFLSLLPKGEGEEQCSIVTRVNGLQTPDDWWFGAKVSRKDEDVRLVVDFSSIPGADAAISDLRAEILSEDGTRKSIGYEELGGSVYSTQALAVRGDVVALRFRIDAACLTDTASNGTPAKG